MKTEAARTATKFNKFDDDLKRSLEIYVDENSEELFENCVD